MFANAFPSGEGVTEGDGRGSHFCKAKVLAEGDLYGNTQEIRPHPTKLRLATFPRGEGMTTPQIIICRAGLLRFGAVMDRYAFLYSSFFILFHWEQGGKIIWMMIVAKKGKPQLL